MISLADAELDQLAVHFIGNPTHDETLVLTSEPVYVEKEIVSPLLKKYFLNSIKTDELHQFHHDSELTLNAVYVFAKQIFDTPDQLFEVSKKLAHHLFEASSHPMIHSGELYIAYFTGVDIDGVDREVLGLFKSENKETFLKIYPQGNSYGIDPQDGININKLDKGCLIFNMDEENGYRVAVVDNLNKKEGAQYWKDQFLKITPRSDSYQHTKQYMQLANNFIRQRLKDEYEMTKVDEIDLSNRSMEFFKNRESFDFNEFASEVMQQPEVVSSFRGFKDEFQQQQGVSIADEFEISPQAVKKQSRIYKSVLKLDKNFHIYIHGNREYIESGFDEERKLNYYKVFFKEES
jgi:hypothetical protein